MTRNILIKEIAFEKNCTLRQAIIIYNDYKSKGKLTELVQKLKNHQEV